MVDLRFVSAELDRTVEALKLVGCDDQELIDGNKKMADLVRAGADEVDALRAEVERLHGLAIVGFVAGADWLRYRLTGFTSFSAERDEAEQEARNRYPFTPPVYLRELAELRDRAAAKAQGGPPPWAPKDDDRDPNRTCGYTHSVKVGICTKCGWTPGTAATKAQEPAPAAELSTLRKQVYDVLWELSQDLDDDMGCKATENRVGRSTDRVVAILLAQGDERLRRLRRRLTVDWKRAGCLVPPFLIVEIDNLLAEVEVKEAPK